MISAHDVATPRPARPERQPAGRSLPQKVDAPQTCCRCLAAVMCNWSHQKLHVGSADRECRSLRCREALLTLAEAAAVAPSAAAMAPAKREMPVSVYKCNFQYLTRPCGRLDSLQGLFRAAVSAGAPHKLWKPHTALDHEMTVWEAPRASPSSCGGCYRHQTVNCE